MSYVKSHTQGGYWKQNASRCRLSTMPCKCHKTPTWISHNKEALYKPNEKTYNLYNIYVTAEHLYSCVKHVVWINANPVIFPVPSSELAHVLYFVFTVNSHLFQCCVEFKDILRNKACRSSEFKLFAVSVWHDWMLTNAASLFLYIYIYIYISKVILLQARCGPEGG